jgi:hypothetical protein
MPESTVYDVFYRLVRGGHADSVRDCWLEFARHEKAGNYSATRSEASRQALHWVSQLEELRSWIPQFGGVAEEECLESIDRGLELFGMLDQTDELLEAARAWAHFIRTEAKSVPSARP